MQARRPRERRHAITHSPLAQGDVRTDWPRDFCQRARCQSHPSAADVVFEVRQRDMDPAALTVRRAADGSILRLRQRHLDVARDTIDAAREVVVAELLIQPRHRAGEQRRARRYRDQRAHVLPEQRDQRQHTRRRAVARDRVDLPPRQARVHARAEVSVVRVRAVAGEQHCIADGKEVRPVWVISAAHREQQPRRHDRRSHLVGRDADEVLVAPPHELPVGRDLEHARRRSVIDRVGHVREHALDRVRHAALAAAGRRLARLVRLEHDVHRHADAATHGPHSRRAGVARRRRQADQRRRLCLLLAVAEQRREQELRVDDSRAGHDRHADQAEAECACREREPSSPYASRCSDCRH